MRCMTNAMGTHQFSIGDAACKSLYLVERYETIHGRQCADCGCVEIGRQLGCQLAGQLGRLTGRQRLPDMGRLHRVEGVRVECG